MQISQLQGAPVNEEYSATFEKRAEQDVERELLGQEASPLISIRQQKTEYADLGELTLAYVDVGNPDDEAIVLIMGYAQQLGYWSDEFVTDLVAGGYRVILFDNRDVGLSSKLDHLKPPRLLWQGLRHRLGLGVQSPYTLEDMADDVQGLMDHLNICKAHIVGASMGGLIAQIFASSYPDRAHSMISIMSTSGDPSLPKPDAKVVKKLYLDKPKGKYSKQTYVDYQCNLMLEIGSQTYPTTKSALSERFGYMFDRCHSPLGAQRQLFAVMNNGANTERLKNISAPSLVINGAQDPICLPSHGRHIADMIPNSKLLIYKDMGHALEKDISQQIARGMLAFLSELKDQN